MLATGCLAHASRVTLKTITKITTCRLQTSELSAPREGDNGENTIPYCLGGAPVHHIVFSQFVFSPVGKCDGDQTLGFLQLYLRNTSGWQRDVIRAAPRVENKNKTKQIKSNQNKNKQQSVNSCHHVKLTTFHKVYTYTVLFILFKLFAPIAHKMRCVRACDQRSKQRIHAQEINLNG